MQPTKVAVNKIFDFKTLATKKDVQRYIRLINTLRHWTNKMNVSGPNLRKLAGKNSTRTWNPQLDTEFKMTQNLARKLDSFSPYDTSKEIFI